MRSVAMTGLALWTRSGPRVWLSLAVAAASILALVPLPTRAMSEDDVFQQAVDYIFTGRIDLKDGHEIVDPKACIVVLPEPDLNRYARYYLNRIKLGVYRIRQTYAG